MDEDDPIAPPPVLPRAFASTVFDQHAESSELEYVGGAHGTAPQPPLAKMQHPAAPAAIGDDPLHVEVVVAGLPGSADEPALYMADIRELPRAQTSANGSP